MAVAAFPAIEPSVRSWTPGARPASVYNTVGGYEVRIQQGSIVVGSSLSLSFANLTEAVGKQITDHYALAQGSFETFSLPAQIFAGMTTFSYITPTGTTWRYAAPPIVSYVAPGIQSISVELLAIPV